MTIEAFIQQTVSQRNLGGLSWESEQEWEERKKTIHYCRICGTVMKGDHYNFVRDKKVVVYRCPQCGNSEMFQQ